MIKRKDCIFLYLDCGYTLRLFCSDAEAGMLELEDKKIFLYSVIGNEAGGVTGCCTWPHSHTVASVLAFY